jgi:hypothetical protein
MVGADPLRRSGEDGEGREASVRPWSTDRPFSARFLDKSTVVVRITAFAPFERRFRSARHHPIETIEEEE